MKKVSLQSKIPSDQKTRDVQLYFNLCHAVRRNQLPKERVEKQITFILANSKTNCPKLQNKFLELRALNRERKDET